MRSIRKILLIFLLILPLAVLLVAAQPSEALADTVKVDSDGVSGKITNLDFSYLDVDPYFDLDFDGHILVIIPKPVIKIGIKIKIGAKGDFDLDINEGKIPGTPTVDAKINSLRGLSNTRLKKDIFDYMPKLGADLDLGAFFVAGATQPAKVKGSFNTQLVIDISTNKGLTYEMNPKCEFTSVAPKNANVDTFVCAGVTFRGSAAFGEIGWDKYTLGPLVEMDMDLMQGVKAVARLEKDKLGFTDNNLIDDSVHTLHTCLENGKDGCVSGKSKESSSLSITAVSDVSLFNIKIIDEKWNVGGKYKNGPEREFVQSLTWKEKLKYQKYCDHLYYKVPVRVWYNRNDTDPVEGVNVHPIEIMTVDSTAMRFNNALTGANETIVRKYQYGKGRANLYLPYKEGTEYTILADTHGTNLTDMTGQAKMLYPIVRGENEPVDIYLESRFTRQLSVKKEWDIDYYGQDRPERIEVVLQCQHYSTGYFCWETMTNPDGTVMMAVLDPSNNWSYTFREVPKYEVNSKGETQEIKYRIRELKAAKNAAGGNGDLFADEGVQLVGQADGLMHIDPGPGKELSKRVVPARFDLDNILVWNAVKDRPFDELWQLSGDISFLTRVGKNMVFPTPTVVYHVDEYTTPVGEQVKAHDTKYQVNYEEEGDLTTITNTAVMDMAIYKRWQLMLGDAEPPDEVWVMLGYRVKQEYRDLIGGGTLERLAGLWLPVWKPLSGDIVSIFNVIASITGTDWLEYADYLITFDVLPKAEYLTFAIARIKKPGDLTNPLVAWRARFCVKKYGWMGIPGVPVEWQAQEISSAIVTDVLKFLTGFDIPISFSLNPFSGQMYVSIPGKPFQFSGKIPGTNKTFSLNKDWERACNIINAWYSSSGDPEPDAIGGTKIWSGDKEENRPDTLTIVAKDPDTGQEVGRTTIKKEDNKGNDTWVWSILSTDGTEVDPDKVYEISEEYPEGYAHEDHYELTTDGHNLTNTWKSTNPPRLVISKTLDVASGAQYTIPQMTFTVKDGNGGEVVSFTSSGSGANVTTANPPVDVSFTKNSDTSFTFTITLKEGKTWPGTQAGEKPDLSGYTVTETINSNAWTYRVSGPSVSTETGESSEDKTDVYTYRVTNTLKDKADIIIRKEWTGEDPNRPDSVRVTLKRDDNEVGTYTLNSGNQWEKKLTDQDRVNPSTGKAYSYAVSEEAVAGYTASVALSESRSDDKRQYTFTVTNTKTRGEETVTVKGTKTWDDEDNAGNTRPDSIRINIIASPGGVVKSVDVAAADNWSWSVPGLPRYTNDRQEIRYSVTEGTASTDGSETVSPGVKGYTAVFSDPVWDDENKTWTCDVTNSTQLVNVPVLKIWDDNNNEFNNRPDKVTVALYSSDEGTDNEIGSAELSEENAWSTSFTSLPKQEGLTYSVTEDPVEGYDATIEGSQTAEGFNVTNRPDGSLMNVHVKKVWTGDENHEDDRPENITVRLMNGTEEAKTLELSKADGWEGFFKAVPAYDSEGQQISYTLEEDEVGGYQAGVVTGSASEGFTITNAFDNTMTITVRKEWTLLDSDQTEPPGVDEVRFVLKRYTEEAPDKVPYPDDTEKVLRKDENWEKQFTDAEIYDGEGHRYIYVAAEAAVSGYRTDYVTEKNDDGNVLIIRNTQDKRKIKVRKVWDDDGAENHPGIHIKVCNGDQTVQERDLASGVTEAVFEDLDVFGVNGKVIEYSVKENPVDGYTTTITGNMADGFTITNLKTRDTRSIKVKKEWVEGAGCEPYYSSVYITLTADGVAKDMACIGQDNNWTWTFTNLPLKTDDGALINYSVMEPAVTGYTSAITGSMAEGFTVTNTRDVMEEIHVTKVWDDHGNYEGKRPGEIELKLLKNGTELDAAEYIVTRTDGSGDEWEYVITRPNGRVFPIYEMVDNVEMETDWQVEETQVVGYDEPLISGNAEEGFVVTNHRAMAVKDITIGKEWLDDALDLYHPDSITVRLLSDRAEEGTYAEIGSRVLNSAGNWETVFKDCPVYAEGGERVISYRVEETLPEDRAEEYGPAFILNNGDSFVIKNWRIFNKICINKTWTDDEPEDRPESVTFRLLNGKEAKATLIVTKADNWINSVEVPVFDRDGNLIMYDLQEDVPEGYQATIEQMEEVENLQMVTVTVNNRKTGEVSGTKIWDDEDDQDGIRPDSVTVILYRNGVKADTQEVTAENGWKFSFDGLEKSEQGEEIEYTVGEEPVAGYETTVDGYTITNRHVPSTVKVSGKKVWDDEDDRDGIRPDSVTVILYGNGNKYAEKTVTAEDGWKFTFHNVPENAGGKTVTYTVDEVPVAGYEKTVDGTTITNKHIPGTIGVSGTKTWDDEDDRDGIRPNSVTVKLLKNGVVTASRKTSADYGWKYSFANLAPAENGMVIQYTVKEDPVPEGYTADIDGYEIINSHDPEETKKYTITYDPNGGTLNGSTEPVSSEYEENETITIREAPVREGYSFLYWKGSEYHPGDEYTVTDDHTFTAQWEKDIPDPPGPSYNFKFTFTKKWSGGHEDSINWTLYNSDGTLAHKRFNKKIVSDTEWRYEAWFAADNDYYIIETVPAGYKVRYENTGVHADVTDRCYNGGTIINYKIPKTGDTTVSSILWAGCILLGLLGAGGALLAGKRRKGRKHL